jgi:two-component sensor histidine kinase
MQARGAAGAFSAEVSAARLPAARAAVVAVRDLTERHRMEQALTRSLREKETLLKEIHHRVKNNLQIVSSLLGMQGDRVAEDAARSALQESAHRVRAMAFVHQQLYGTHDLDHVDVATYAATLCRSLQESLAPDAEVTLRLRDVQVGIDQAIPVGLILNELITNALKHGRRADGGCALTVEIEPVGPGLRLAVADDGPGFAAPPGPGTLGVQLIQGLARQLRGSVTFSDGPGARVTLTVPALAAVVSRLPPAAPPAPTP